MLRNCYLIDRRLNILDNKYIYCLKRIEEIEQLVLFAFGAAIVKYVVLARSLIISSNRETCIVPMYHEVEIVFATCIIIDQATGRNWRGIFDRSDDPLSHQEHPSYRR